MTQAINRSAEEFSQRTDALAERLQVPLRALPEKTGISERMLFAYRTAENRVTAKAWAKLRSAEIAAGLREPEAHEKFTHPDPLRGEEMRINPPYVPPQAITRAQIETYISHYLDEAAGTPGGYGLAWGLIRKHLDISDLKRMQESP